MKKKKTNDISRESIISKLIKLRLQKDLTQKDLAKNMKCSPSKISRIESGADTNLDWNDLLGYTKALNLQIEIFFNDKSLSTETRIKELIFKIHSLLENLAELAKEMNDDKTLPDKIHKFYGNVLMELLVKFDENTKGI